jgi:hypothetical protein
MNGVHGHTCVDHYAPGEHGLEAEEAGIRSTGIGCYFDDAVREVFGIKLRDWQSTTSPHYAWQP